MRFSEDENVVVLLFLLFTSERRLCFPPDELHPWVCRLIECAGMADQTFNTFDTSSCPTLPQHDLQSAALIIVTMKLLFGADDHAEW